MPASGPRSGEATWLWLIKIATGPLLVLILILHLTVNHMLGSTASGIQNYDDVIRYFQNPIIPIIEIIFVITVVTHSLLGLHGILLDLNPPRPLLIFANWFHVLIGVAASAYGIWLALAIAAKSP